MSTTLITLQGELDKVNTAINSILTTGQTFFINSGGGSRSVTYPDLSNLYKIKENLENRIAALSGLIVSRGVAGW